MKKYLLILMGCSVLILSSCLKDKNVSDQTYGMDGANAAKLVELVFPGGAADPVSSGHLNSFAFDFEDAPLEVDIVEVRLTSDKAPTQDVTVTLSLANSATMISDYNTENGTNYVSMPASLFQIPSLAITIPAGQKVGTLKLKTNAINFDPSSTYALGFEIGSISDASYSKSGNFGTVIAVFSAKNAYDGLYEITGTLTDANGVYVGDYGDPAFPRQYELITTSGVSGVFYDRSWDYPYYIVINGTTGGAATTNIKPKLTFDPATNVITNIQNVGTSTAVITVQAGSKYNPSNKSLEVKWVAGRWNVNEHWAYIGPR